MSLEIGSHCKGNESLPSVDFFHWRFLRWGVDTPESWCSYKMIQKMYLLKVRIRKMFARKTMLFLKGKMSMKTHSHVSFLLDWGQAVHRGKPTAFDWYSSALTHIWFCKAHQELPDLHSTVGWLALPKTWNRKVNQTLEITATYQTLSKDIWFHILHGPSAGIPWHSAD